MEENKTTYNFVYPSSQSKYLQISYTYISHTGHILVFCFLLKIPS